MTGRLTRRVTATIAMAAMAALILADYQRVAPNPYQQPAIVAIGSGASSAGGFCGALPE